MMGMRDLKEEVEAYRVRRRLHTRHHADLEYDLIRYVVDKGWLDGKLRRPPKPKPTAADKRAARLVVAEKHLATWERKAKLAATKVKKWKLQVRRLQKPKTSPCITVDPDLTRVSNAYPMGFVEI